MILALVVLAAAVAVGAVLIFRNDNDGKPTAGGSGGSVQLSGIGAYDPIGGDGEHDADAPNATDGKQSTYWPTESYRTAPGLGKAGVGLVLDAGRQVDLHRLSFTTSTPGLTAEILAGNSRGGPFDSVVGPSQQVGDRAEYTIGGGAYRYYVIWITRLGDGYRNAHIDEVSAG